MKLRVFGGQHARRNFIAVAVVLVTALFASGLLYLWNQASSTDPITQAGSAATTPEVGLTPTFSPFPASSALRSGIGSDASPAASATGASGAATAGGAQAGGPTIGTSFAAMPNFTSGTTFTRDDGRHQVEIVVESDSAIRQLRYGIANGTPGQGAYVDTKSPFRVSSPAQGKGLLAGVQAQASRFASKITCRIYVDGRLQTQRSTLGAYATVACYA